MIGTLECDRIKRLLVLLAIKVMVMENAEDSIITEEEEDTIIKAVKVIVEVEE